MALDQSALLSLVESLRAGDESSMMRRMLTIMLQQLIEAEATAAIGAERYERSEARTTQRNGHRARTVSTTSGDLEVAVPKLRQGSFFPSLLTPRRRVDVALHAVVMEAFVLSGTPDNTNAPVGRWRGGRGCAAPFPAAPGPNRTCPFSEHPALR